MKTTGPHTPRLFTQVANSGRYAPSWRPSRISAPIATVPSRIRPRGKLFAHIGKRMKYDIAPALKEQASSERGGSWDDGVSHHRVDGRAISLTARKLKEI